MKRFQFRLSTLLKLRENERQQRQVEFAQALEAERLMIQEIESISAEIHRAKEKVRVASAPGEIPIDTLLEFQRYGLHLRLQASIASERLGHIRAEANRRRELLVEANRQVRMLEKLRERQAAAFAESELVQERKLLDEVGQKRLVQSD